MGPAGSAGLAAERHRWRVRLRDDQDRVQGAGTMLDDRHLLTCARVVERCGGPDARVKVEFAGLAGLGHAHATVEADGWRPSAGACRRASGWTSRVDSEGAGVTELARFEPQQGGEVVVEVDTGQATTRVSRRDGLVLDTKVSFERALAR